MNRGAGKRRIFENRRDARNFFCELALAIRAGGLEVHAFSLLPNHFHLLVRSPEGDMSRGMRRFQNGHARRFNRDHGRDGPLYRGRYCSRRILSDAHWIAVVRYIDVNACEAKLARRPEAYPFGSARCYLRASGPPWLTRDVVESHVSGECGRNGYDPADYLSFLHHGPSDAERRVVERRMDEPEGGWTDDPLDRLLRGSIAEISRWLHEQAMNRASTRSIPPLVTAATLDAVVARRRHAEMGGSGSCAGPKEEIAWDSLHAGLLRGTCGLSFEDVVRSTGFSLGGARGRVQAHIRLLRKDPDYLRICGEIVADALRRDWPQSGRVKKMTR